MIKEFKLEKIKELMKALEESTLSRIKLKVEGMEVELERKGEEAPPPPPRPAPAEHAEPQTSAPPPPPAQEEGKFVVSPIVGTFYSSPAPEEPSLIKVGDQVDDETIVCIIEAMKVMNEIKAGVSGTVKKILVENGNPVEFGTKLFVVE